MRISALKPYFGYEPQYSIVKVKSGEIYATNRSSWLESLMYMYRYILTYHHAYQSTSRRVVWSVYIYMCVCLCVCTD